MEEAQKAAVAVQSAARGRVDRSRVVQKKKDVAEAKEVAAEAARKKAADEAAAAKAAEAAAARRMAAERKAAEEGAAKRALNALSRPGHENAVVF